MKALAQKLAVRLNHRCMGRRSRAACLRPCMLVYLHAQPVRRQIAVQARRYDSAQLIEINAHSLFSKWFSESGKLVSKLFAKVHRLSMFLKRVQLSCPSCGGAMTTHRCMQIGDMLEGGDQLVFVLIDEVYICLCAARTPSDGVGFALRHAAEACMQAMRNSACPAAAASMLERPADILIPMQHR